MAHLIITGFSNVSKEGLTIHLNRPARLKTGTGHFDEFWISWDKIGQNLFDDYSGPHEIDELRKEQEDGE